MNRRISVGLAGLIFACAFALRASAQQPQAPGAAVFTFKDVADLLAGKGVPKTLGPTFCIAYELDCGGQPLSVKLEGAHSENDMKNAAIGKIVGQDTVLLLRQDKDKAKGELYVCDPFGNFIRGYVIINAGRPSRMTADQAHAGFEAEKKWWIDWLPTHILDTGTTAAPK